MSHNRYMSEQSLLSFKVWCSACYGTEIWRLGRITRLLTAAGILPPSSESDIEWIAEQFTVHCKEITCPDCGKKGTLTVRRIDPGT